MNRSFGYEESAQAYARACSNSSVSSGLCTRCGIQNPLNVTQEGTIQFGAVWTGTDPSGNAVVGNELRALDLTVTDGTSAVTAGTWVQTGPYNADSQQFLYGISDVLTVPGSGPIHEFQGHYYSWVNS